jgi:hypothetical protein
MALPIPAAREQATREQIPTGARFGLGRIISTLPSWQILPEASIPMETLNLLLNSSASQS